jgi:cobalt-precorrin 5A hydrolase
MKQREKVKALDQDIAVLAVTKKGFRVAQFICYRTGAHLCVPEKLLKMLRSDAELRHIQVISYAMRLSKFLPHIFNKYRGLIFVMALGIVNRVIAPLIHSKYSDPAVVTVDDAARYAVSTLSGHEGGANELTYLVASLTGAAPVITTATEANKIYICGIGCRKSTPAVDIIYAVQSACTQASLAVEDIRCLASVWLKKDEPGLVEAAHKLGLNIVFIPQWMIKYAQGLYKKSDFVYSKIGVEGVCEPTALLAGRNTTLILEKQIYKNVTAAVAKEELLTNPFTENHQ